MRLLTLHELLRLPRPELMAIRSQIERRLLEESCDRQIALANLRLIDRVLSRSECMIGS